METPKRFILKKIFIALLFLFLAFVFVSVAIIMATNIFNGIVLVTIALGFSIGLAKIYDENVEM